MDQQKLRTLVFEKTGVKIDVDDPVFALVAMNEAVLEEAVERHVKLLNDASGALAGRVASLQGGSTAGGPADRRVLAIAAGAALLGALLVLAGQALFFKPAPAPAPIVQAKELTPEQQAAIANGEKLARAVAKLDKKTRNTIEAEMQKP
jgi:hypothetical protein